MSLAAVGVGQGPDLAALAAARARSPKTHLYAAGGVRGPADLVTIEEAGAAGALVASAIHDGGLAAPR